MRHQKTLEFEMFPQVQPHQENGGETKSESRLELNPEPKDYEPEPRRGYPMKEDADVLPHDTEIWGNGDTPQPSIDEIWEWLGNPDAE